MNPDLAQYIQRYQQLLADAQFSLVKAEVEVGNQAARVASLEAENAALREHIAEVSPPPA